MKFLKKKKKVDEEAVSKDEAAQLQQQILTLQSDVQRLYKVCGHYHQCKCCCSDAYLMLPA